MQLRGTMDIKDLLEQISKAQTPKKEIKLPKGIKKEEETEQNKFYQELYNYEPQKEFKWFQFLAKRKDKKLKKKYPSSLVLIRMELNSGKFIEFYGIEEFGSFVYNKKRYVIDENMKYYVINRDIWAYDYAEDLSLPIRKKMKLTEEGDKAVSLIESEFRKPKNPRIPVSEIKTIIENSKVVDVENSLNPSILKRFTDSEVIKQVLEGASIGRLFKIILIIVIVIGILMLADLAVDMYDSGLFEKISESFKKE